MEVFNPTGATAVSAAFAPRLKSLEGKTVGLLSNGIWQSLRTLPMLQELLQGRYPKSNFVIIPGNAQIQDEETMNSIVEMECSAVIVGNAA